MLHSLALALAQGGEHAMAEEKLVEAIRQLRELDGVDPDAEDCAHKVTAIVLGRDALVDPAASEMRFSAFVSVGHALLFRALITSDLHTSKVHIAYRYRFLMLRIQWHCYAYLASLASFVFAYVALISGALWLSPTWAWTRSANTIGIAGNPHRPFQVPGDRAACSR